MNWKTVRAQEREAMKGAPLQVKLRQFWDYYRWPAIVAVVILAVIVSEIWGAMTKKTVVLEGICLNCFDSSYETDFSPMIQDFLQFQGLDENKYTVALNTNLYLTGRDTEDVQTAQQIAVRVAAGDLDFLVGDLESMTRFAGSEMVCDLSQMLDAALLERCRPYLLYVDPETGELAQTGIPVLLDVSGFPGFRENYRYSQEPAVLAAAVNGNVNDFVSFLLSEAET